VSLEFENVCDEEGTMCLSPTFVVASLAALLISGASIAKLPIIGTVYYNYGGKFKRIASCEHDAVLIRDDSAFRHFLTLAGEVSDAKADD
jgi:hypothetical protein